MDSNITFYLVSAMYGLAVLIFTFFSLFTIYVFIRYGKSKNIAVAGSLIYGVLFLTLLTSSLVTLSKLRV